jgi:Zn-dependent protease with chaperone function
MFFYKYIVWNWSIKNVLFDANIELAYLYNNIFNPVNLVFLFLSMQYVRLTTYCHIFVKELITDFCWFQSHLLSQSGNNTVLLMLFVIMTGFFPQIISFSVWFNLILWSIYAINFDYCCYINSFSIFSVNIISLLQEVRDIFVIKAAVELQNNLPFCD